jgi:curli biogenesis system outer membrane secretion channel CsgG
MPMRQHFHCKAALLALAIASLAGCASTPAEPVPFKAVPQARIVQPGYTQPGAGLVTVDVRFRDALVYIDGEQVTDLMNGEHVVFYLSPGVHRIGVSTQFDPVVEMHFTVTADTRYTNRASVTFGEDHRIALRRVAQ